jgi:hypothetical protein
VAYLRAIIHPITHSLDVVDAYMAIEPDREMELLETVHGLLGLPTDEYTLWAIDGAQVLQLEAITGGEPWAASHVLVYPHDPNPDTFIGEVQCLGSPADLCHLLLSPAQRRHSGWDDPERLRYCMRYWEDPAKVSEQDVAWCFARNNVPPEAFMKIEREGYPDGEPRFAIGFAPNHQFRVVLNPHISRGSRSDFAYRRGIG